MAGDLAIVGLGPSNVNLFAELVRQARTIGYLSAPNTIPQKKIYLIDYEGNHGTGKAWGRHAHPSMLFQYRGGSVDGFSTWLHASEAQWLPVLETHRNGALKTWFAENREKLGKKEYDKIHMPRMVYGMFRKERLLEALQDLPPHIEVIMLDGKVTGITKDEAGKNRLQFEAPATEITLVRGEDGQIRPQRKTGKPYDSLGVDMDVIGVGPPEPAAFDKVRGNPDYFANPTELHPHAEGEDFAAQFKNAVLKKFRSTGKKVEVGILGAGLAFLDMANLIYNDDELKNTVHLTSISSSGYPRTEKEAEPGKQTDMAPESQIALNGLDVRFIAARVEDVEPAKRGNGITVRTSDKHLDEPGYRYRPGARSGEHVHHFDIAVQTLGFGKWKDMGVFKTGLDAGLFKEAPRGNKPETDSNLQMGAGNYINGFIVESNISSSLKARGEKHEGFLDNSYRNGPHLASTLSSELFKDQIQQIKKTLSGRPTERPVIARFSRANATQSQHIIP